VDADVEEQAEAEHDGEHGGAAVRDQRQWHADYWDEPHDHCRVDEHIE
jgi:hypothetical protein